MFSLYNSISQSGYKFIINSDSVIAYQPFDWNQVISQLDVTIISVVKDQVMATIAITSLQSVVIIEMITKF